MASYVELPPKKGSKLPRIKITVELGYDKLGNRIREFKTVEVTRLTDRVINKAIRDFELELSKEQKKNNNDLTYRQAVEMWWNNHANKLSVNTRIAYDEAIDDSLDYFGDVKINELKKVDFVEYRNHLIDNNILNRTGKFGACKRVFSKMFEWEVLPSNPCAGLNIAQGKKEMDFYDEIEINQLFEVLKTANKKHAVFIKLAVLSGMRSAEIAGLTLENIDFKNNLIHVKHNLNFEKEAGFSLGPTKNKKERTLAMPENFMKELRDYAKIVKKKRIYFGSEWRGIEGMNLIFCNDDGYPHYGGLLPQVFKKILRKHKLREIRFHDLRHSHASLLLSKNVNIKVIQERLGHSSITITMDTYSHLTEEDERTVANLLNVIL